ncbi:acetyl-CoA carboxylase biotin carboxylase subunit [Helicobacter sp.]|uniref:acetyl-CoA carboxylase biotin carboxylase subunit n=1 Tax=Helicobacter sp. TaxID=218 RepID=UPI0025B85B3F|nr:acetyl-CoA carboxylase biotin carboxylase subunit [Helicobacter sp.]MCI5968470.1 acetyl-CoA carboxylase biotin carboxylase subunit [Helicobacter sp.]MDY2585255.1 acetyl-CoA carboxylase biotin carboxylase subunit [Helicobacter sp.]
MPYKPQNIKKVLVANRGEIAVRIIQAAHELNMQAVSLYTDADKGNLASQLADEAVYIGENLAHKSYLDMDKVIAAAKSVNADAIHPGYGFLSENATFAQKVIDAGMIFVGPSSEIIKTMGDKAQAILKAKEANVPTIPGSPVLKDLDEAKKYAQQLGYPLALKAIAGGGGKGIRIVQNEEELTQQYEIAIAEAKAAFGNGGVYLEVYLPQAKHIEVQVLGDGKDVIHLYERECSLQRRRQKIVEEAPSPSLDSKTRQRLCDSALNLARLVHYKGAGTLEFLYDEERDGFYFLEMNTRIQVEHAITEMVTGVDIVREMLRIADGEPLRFKQEDIKLRGSSIEIRINAEDPANNFFPHPGVVSEVHYPTGAGIRVDSMLFNGRNIPPFYDSLIAKLIIYDESRPLAVSRMNRALRQMSIKGIKTTIPLFVDLFKDENIIRGNYHINFLESWMQKTNEN